MIYKLVCSLRGQRLYKLDKSRWTPWRKWIRID